MSDGGHGPVVEESSRAAVDDGSRQCMATEVSSSKRSPARMKNGPSSRRLIRRARWLRLAGGRVWAMWTEILGLLAWGAPSIHAGMASGSRKYWGDLVERVLALFAVGTLGCLGHWIPMRQI